MGEREPAAGPGDVVDNRFFEPFLDPNVVQLDLSGGGEQCAQQDQAGGERKTGELQRGGIDSSARSFGQLFPVGFSWVLNRSKRGAHDHLLG